MNADLGKYLLEYQMLSDLSREANIVDLSGFCSTLNGGGINHTGTYYVYLYLLSRVVFV